MKPRPPRNRICTRYNRDGKPCLNTTIRADGWCGECEGFPTKEAAPSGTWRGTGRPAPSAIHEMPPLDPEEAYTVHVTYTARQQFIEKHGGTDAEAEAQIRSLLEDILQTHRVGLRKSNGWRVKTDCHKYTLVISDTDFNVTAYTTVHAERSYAQVKAGVPSRISKGRSHGKNRSGDPRWRIDMTEEHTASLDIAVSPSAISLYARRNGLPKPQRDNPEEWLTPAVEALRAALAAWDGKPGHLPDTVNPGSSWIIVDRPEEHVVTSYAAADRIADGGLPPERTV